MKCEYGGAAPGERRCRKLIGYRGEVVSEEIRRIYVGKYLSAGLVERGGRDVTEVRCGEGGMIDRGMLR